MSTINKNGRRTSRKNLETVQHLWPVHHQQRMEHERESLFRYFVHDHNICERFERRHRNYADRKLQLVRKRRKPNIVTNPNHNNLQIILIIKKKRRNE